MAEKMSWFDNYLIFVFEIFGKYLINTLFINTQILLAIRFKVHSSSECDEVWKFSIQKNIQALKISA